MSTHEIIAGIDLGTTNSAIGFLDEGTPRLIEIDGCPTMPSCVGLDASGKILVGQAAVNQLLVAPGRTVTSIKRQMGSEIPVKLGDREYRPEEISAFILKRLKKEMETALDRPVKKAVITVPAYFDEKQRRATQDAAQLAGLESVRIFNEPTAAALAYNLQNEERQTILVYDLGGGTFDVSLVVCEKGLVEVKASHGDTHLGGDDFDELLVGHLSSSWEGDSPLDTSDLKTSRRLKVAAEAAKCRLSDHPFASVREEYLDTNSHLDIEVDRLDFEELVAPLLEKTWDAMREAMNDGKTLPGGIDKILLAGGSTRIPFIHRMIHERIGIAPSAELNPDHIVALGAAIQGGIMAGDKVDAILVDIATHTFSIEALGEDFVKVCAPIIPRGTPLPVTRSEAFQTTRDNQVQVEIEVFQGESIDAEENLRIGRFEVEGLRKAPAGNTVTCQFALDLDGMLEVTALEKISGLAKSVIIDTRDVHTSLDLDTARQRVAQAFGETDSESPTAHVHKETTRAKELRKRAEKILAGEIDEEDKSDIQNLLNAMRKTIKAQDFSSLDEHSSQLEDILFYLED